MEAEKVCGVGDIKIGKTNLGQLWKEVDRNLNQREGIYNLAQMVGCTPDCPCRNYEPRIDRPFGDAPGDYKHFNCGFYILDDSDWYYGDLYGKTKFRTVKLRCGLRDIIKSLDLAYDKGSAIPLRRDLR